MEKKTVLILGGNGFIGTNFARFLVENSEFAITVFDKSLPKSPLEKITYIEGDFFNDVETQAAAHNFDWVIHALSTVNPGNSNDSYFRGYSKDLIQTIKICDSLIGTTTRMLFLSSGGTVYGIQENQPIPETATPSPINHYGGIKLCIENYLRINNKQFGTKSIIARISNPYGPGQDYTKGVGFIDAVLRCGLENKTLEVWGDGSTIRDYVYIDDVCSMLLDIMHYEGALDTLNVCSGHGVSQNQVISIVQKLIPGLEYKHLDGRSIDVSRVILDPSRINAISHTIPRSVELGIKEYYDFLIKQYGDAIH